MSLDTDSGGDDSDLIPCPDCGQESDWIHICPKRKKKKDD